MIDKCPGDHGGGKWIQSRNANVGEIPNDHCALEDRGPWQDDANIRDAGD
jgi:hypothetical protein